MTPLSSQQEFASTVLMVRPACFGYNPETASSNAFQQASAQANVSAEALKEFDATVELLHGHGIETLIFEDRPGDCLPDSVFPNNWVSMQPDGTVIQYPMMARSRRRERRMDIITTLLNRHHPAAFVDLTAFERAGRFLEGTGSLVPDRRRRVVYACISPRTDRLLAEAWARKFGYQPLCFHAEDKQGHAIYHTNVVMGLGAGFALVCLEAIPNETERNAVKTHIEAGGRMCINISRLQMEAFAGNVLQLQGKNGPVLAISHRAFRALSAAQLDSIEAFADFAVAPLDLIETCGGGSVRCMLAEVF